MCIALDARTCVARTGNESERRPKLHGRVAAAAAAAMHVPLSKCKRFEANFTNSTEHCVPPPSSPHEQRFPRPPLAVVLARQITSILMTTDHLCVLITRHTRRRYYYYCTITSHSRRKRTAATLHTETINRCRTITLSKHKMQSMSATKTKATTTTTTTITKAIQLHC